MRLLCFALAAAVATAFSPTASLAVRRPVVGGAASSASPRAARRAVPSMGMVNIKITVKKNGILEQEVTGMKGPGCYKLTQALNKALGGLRDVPLKHVRCHVREWHDDATVV